MALSPTSSRAGGGDTVALLSDTRATTVEGGATVTGAWTPCPLNTKDSDPEGIVSLAANQFTLEAGTYEMDADGVIYVGTFTKLRIRNVTDGTTVGVGFAQECGDTVNRSSTFRIQCVVTIAAAKAFELQYQVSVADATMGLGRAAGFAESEVYRRVRIAKRS